jgi:hypothetical protein
MLKPSLIDSREYFVVDIASPLATKHAKEIYLSREQLLDVILNHDMYNFKYFFTWFRTNNSYFCCAESCN